MTQPTPPAHCPAAVAATRHHWHHRHLTRANAAGVALAVAVGVLAVVSAGLPGSPRSAATSSTVSGPAAQGNPGPSAPRRAAPPAPVLPTLPPLDPLIQAGLLVSSTQPMSPALVQRLVGLASANASLVVAVGQVQLGNGQTRALAADPAQIRTWTPSITARATGVWQRAAIGEVVVAHAVARANAVLLGGAVTVRSGAAAVQTRVGAFATTQLPGVGLVLDGDQGSRLGLPARSGVLLAVTKDPQIAAAVIEHQLGGTGLHVDTVLSTVVTRAGWVPPAIGPITSPFGMRIHPITHLPQFHDGIDIGAPIGAPVYAMSDGQVLYAGPASGFGNEIILSHAGGVATVYGHVSQILVQSGSVRAGQVIALVGSEGESTGPHLHAEVHVQDQPVDPVAWLRGHGVVFTR